MKQKGKERRFLTCLMMAFIAVQLSSCSLATEDGDQISGEDTLVGVFVTTEYVDTVDWDTMDVGALVDGKLISSSDGKIPGSFDEENGQFVFEGLEGFSLGSIAIKNQENPEDFYQCSIASDCFDMVRQDYMDQVYSCSGSLYYDITRVGSEYRVYQDTSYKKEYPNADVDHIVDEDGSESYEVLIDGEALTFYTNPVYETEQGQIYLAAGQGMRVSGTGVKETEAQCSMTVSETAATTEHGERSETVNTIKVTYSGKAPVQSVTFSLCSGSGKVLEKESYQADAIPDSIRWKDGTAYILVSLQKTDGTEEYDLIHKDDRSYSVYLQSDSLILKCVEVEITS